MNELLDLFATETVQSKELCNDSKILTQSNNKNKYFF
jgi:hypothetical protein